jgi:hypothetical protein
MRPWWFIALTLTALTLGLAFAHVLELRPKLGYDPALYLILHRTLYGGFGTIGGAIDVGAVLPSLVLVYVVRGRPLAFRWATGGAVALISAHVAWWLWVNPANIAMRQLPLDNPRADWQLLRDQWEYTDLARFFVQLAAFLSQLTSVLVEITTHSERG